MMKICHPGVDRIWKPSLQIGHIVEISTSYLLQDDDDDDDDDDNDDDMILAIILRDLHLTNKQFAYFLGHLQWDLSATI